MNVFALVPKDFNESEEKDEATLLSDIFQSSSSTINFLLRFISNVIGTTKDN